MVVGRGNYGGERKKSFAAAAADGFDWVQGKLRGY